MTRHLEYLRYTLFPLVNYQIVVAYVICLYLRHGCDDMRKTRIVLIGPVRSIQHVQIIIADYVLLVFPSYSTIQ